MRTARLAGKSTCKARSSWRSDRADARRGLAAGQSACLQGYSRQISVTAFGPGNLGRGSCRREQHEVVAVVKPGLVQDVLHVSCGRCRGDVEGPGYLGVGDDTLADQVKD